MLNILRLFSQIKINSSILENVNNSAKNIQQFQKRTVFKFIEKPKPGQGKAYRRIVHFPKEYTVKPLEVTNLAGRDPLTGRIVCKGIGGGIKHKYHWIKWVRDGPTEGPPQIEKVTV